MDTILMCDHTEKMNKFSKKTTVEHRQAVFKKEEQRRMTRSAANIESILNWLRERQNRASFAVREIPLSELGEWRYDDRQGSLVHRSGKFFSIRGIEVKTDFGPVSQWTQPIINQPEIGLLGMLSRKMDGRRQYLMQAKMEPGNINLLQLAPTVQATRSNYSRVHRGKEINYLEYFIHPSGSRTLMDTLQYEQGGRFYRKLNRNILLDIEGDIPVLEDYRWLSSAEIALLLNMSNIVNMDSRSVLSCMLKKDEDEAPVHTDRHLSDWLSAVNDRHHLETTWVALDKLADWRFHDQHIQHREEKYFTVVGIETTASNREVKSWRQPIFKETNAGLAGLIIKEINETPHYLMQVVLEAGKKSVKLAPTVQCSDYKNKDGAVTYIDRLLHGGEILYDQIQSEEGGRFYHFQNRNVVVKMKDDLHAEDHFKWVTHNQIVDLIAQGHLNIEARTLLVCWNALNHQGVYEYD